MHKCGVSGFGNGVENATRGALERVAVVLVYRDDWAFLTAPVTCANNGYSKLHAGVLGTRDARSRPAGRHTALRIFRDSRADTKSLRH